MATSGYFTGSGYGGAPPLPTAQERADRIAAEARAAVRRPLFRPPPPRPRDLADTTDLALQRVAEELELMSRTVEGVGERLADDAAVAMRHGTLIQQFDIVAQVLGHLARVVATDERVEAMDRIGMEALRRRLLRGLTGRPTGTGPTEPGPPGETARTA